MATAAGVEVLRSRVLPLILGGVFEVGARGPAAAPAALRLLKGRSDGRDSGGRVVAPTPEFKRVPPNPPAWLSREAAAEWKRVVPGLSRLDLLKPEDRAALTVYCETWAQWVDATRSVHEVGLTITTEHTTKTNPAVVVAQAAATQLRAFAGEFGLTPSSESRLVRKSDDESGDDNPFGA